MTTHFFTARLSAEIERDLRELSVRYASACDRRDEHGFRELFTDDARVILHYAAEDEPRIAEGRETVGRIPEGLTRFDKTYYQLGQTAYADGDEPGTATGEVYCTIHNLNRGDPITDRTWYMRYHDDYRMTEDGWRIARREAFIEFSTTTPVVWAAGLS